MRIPISTSFAALILLTSTNLARPQAWVLPAGEGAVSFTYQAIDNTGHRLTDGRTLPVATSFDMSLYLETEYAFTNRLSLIVGIPYVFAKYTDSNPPPSPVPYLPVDQCHCWHSGFQDVGATARYNLANGAFGMTPFVSVGVPSQNYNFRGESALGDRLREVRIGVDAGRQMRVRGRYLAIQGRYSYAFLEKVLGISLNRSNIRGQIGYTVKRKLSVLGQFYWQRTHGGLRLGSLTSDDLAFPGDVNTPDLWSEHDRMLRDNYWRAGGALNYPVRQVDLFAAWTAFVSGTDTHAGTAVTIGFTVPFRIAGRRR